jgi:hypothetical protein
MKGEYDFFFHINEHLPVLQLLPMWYSSSIYVPGKHHICGGIPTTEQSILSFKSCVDVTFVAYPWEFCWEVLKAIQ